MANATLEQTKATPVKKVVEGHVGLAVLYWESVEGSELKPIPGVLLYPTPGGKGWTLNIHRPGLLVMRSDIVGSAEPKERSWTVSL